VGIVHRYVLWSVALTCFGAVLMFAFLVLAGSVVKDMLSLLAEGRLTFLSFFNLISIYFPYVFVHALPLGLLTGILLTMGRLSALSEVTAMRAAGFSTFRLSGSVFVFAVMGSMLALIINFYFGPIAKAQYRKEQENIIQKNPLGYVVEKTFVRDFPDIVFYVSEKRDNVLQDLWVWKLDERFRARQFYRAQRGYFRYDEEDNTLNLVLEDGQVENRGGIDPEDWMDVDTMVFGSLEIELNLDGILGEKTFQKKLTWMTFQELRAEKAYWEPLTEVGSLEDREIAKENLREARMSFQEKFASGFSVISFALLAVPLGIQAQRKETSANLFIAIGLGLAYYLMMISVGWFKDSSPVRPDMLYWIPNVVYQGIGLWLLYRTDQGRAPKLAAPEAA